MAHIETDILRRLPNSSVFCTQNSKIIILKYVNCKTQGKLKEAKGKSEENLGLWCLKMIDQTPLREN